jgi:hypothetical protein
VIPTAYEILDEWKKKVMAWFGRPAPQHAAPVAAVQPAFSGD